MRVFLTGATGFIGQRIIKELHANGHAVLGLARSDEGAAALTAQGVMVHRGELTDLESLAAGARAADGVIHCAFIHDFTKFVESSQIDRTAVEAMLAAVEGSGKPFVLTSGTGTTGTGRSGTEADDPPTEGFGTLRGGTEMVVKAAAARGVRSLVVRLPQVHGRGGGGFVKPAIDSAKEKGWAFYVGDGENRWPAAHVNDVARLYRLALEKGESGARYNAVAEEGVKARDIAETIGWGLGVPLKQLTAEEAAAELGFLGMIASMDMPASSAWTQRTMGWTPAEPHLIPQLRDRSMGYFD